MSEYDKLSYREKLAKYLCDHRPRRKGGFVENLSAPFSAQSPACKQEYLDIVDTMLEAIKKVAP